MRPSVRTALFYFFCLLFVGIGSLLLFYATGYRYHFAKNKIEKIGQISIDSAPSDVDVLLNGNPPLGFADRIAGRTHATTPLRISRLLPGDYTLTLKKDGYFNLTRTVTVYSGQTVLMQEVALLRKPATTTVFSEISGADQILSFSEGSRVGIVRGRSIDIIDTTSKKPTLLSTVLLPENPMNFLPSPSTRRYLIELRSRWFVLDQSGELVPWAFEHKPQQIEWSLNDDDLLFARDSQGIASLSRVGKIRRSLYRGKSEDIALTEEGIVLLTRRSAEQHLLFLRYGAAIPHEVPIPPQLQGAVQSIEHATGAMIYIRIGSSQVISLPLSLPQRTIARISGNKSLVVDKTRTIFWDEFEISLVDDSKGVAEVSLITRQSSPVQSVIAHPHIPFVFVFLKNGTAHAFDLSRNRDSYEIAHERLLSPILTRSGIFSLVRLESGKQEIRFTSLIP